MKRISRTIVGLVLLAGCSRTGSDTPQAALQPEETQVGGITWSFPAAWSKQHELPMRVTTYVIPAAEGDSEPGECGVFFFGEQQGGDVDANIQRWGSQFEGATQAEKTTLSVDGLTVHIVRIEGTFLAPGGPMMQSQGKKEHYKLLGAIVNGPGGMVFFKSTGPASTIDAAESAFRAMIQSIRKA